MQKSELPLNALRALEAVLRLGRIQAAADELGVTHGAVSRQISTLEQRLGLPLFEGDRAQRRPTAETAALLPRLTSAFDELVAVTRQVARRDPVLTVSCPPALLIRWLIARLLDFEVMNPGMEIRAVHGNGFVDFEQDGTDIAIRTSRYAVGAHKEMLGSELFGLVCPPNLLAALSEVSPAALARLPYVETRRRPGQWRDWCGARKVDPGPPKRIFAEFHHAAEATLSGHGIAFVPEIIVRREIATGQLIAPFGFEDTGAAYYALAAQPDLPAQRLFLDWLKTQFE